jgi:hypothetical protein
MASGGRRGRVETHAHRRVLGGHPAGPEADLKPPLAEQVEAGQFLREYHRMVVIDAQHAEPDHQRGRGVGGDGGRRNRGDVLRRVPRGGQRRSRPEIVILEQQAVVPESFEAPGALLELAP